MASSSHDEHMRSFGNLPASGEDLIVRQPQPASRATAVVDLAALQNASRVLHDQFLKDSQIIPDLGDTLSAAGGQSSASYSISLDDYRVPFQKRRLVGIPESLFQYYNSTSVTSHMGIIPEVERVWITIDHKLFLWDYIEGQEICSFVDQPDVISHVAVVKPKPGVFVDEISHLLVICTPVSVLIIGLSSSPSSGPNSRVHKEIRLYATDMSAPTEVEMTSIIGTKDGRIFMSGSQDGYLYELHYQESESWFGKRVQLINHSVGGVQSLFPRFASTGSEDRIISVVSDIPRSCFYTLTAKNTISVYKPNGDKSIHHLQTISGLYKMAQGKAPGSPALTPQNFQIIGLCVVNQSESRTGVQLVAITTNGVRLYFSPAISYNFSYGGFGGGHSEPRSLQLVHVRLPPPNLPHPDELLSMYRPSAPVYGSGQAAPQPAPRPYIISALENCCYSEGLTIAAQQGDSDGTDFILCMSPDLTRIGSLNQLHAPMQPVAGQPTNYMGATYVGAPGPSRPPLTEYASILAIPGRTWAMAPVPSTKPPAVSSPSPVVTNELATQFAEPPRQFMILTNVGLTFLVKRRAVDYLKAVIEEVQSEGNVQPIIEFRDSFGRDQTCAMLLGLASGNTFLDIGEGPGFGTITAVNPDIAAVAKQAFYDFGERPIWAERVTYGTSDAQGTAIFSGRREGFALYFARLVWPLWKSKLTKPGPLGLQQSNIPDAMLVNVQKNLYALEDFLNKNPHLFHSSPGDIASVRTAPGNEQEAWKAEQSSVQQLQALLTRTVEAISFVLLLNDYKLGDLIAKCEADIQKLISSFTFEELITTQNGMTASRALVNVVIDQQIGQQISVDTISEVLQQRCGSFCSTGDVMLYKAKENVRKAVETRNLTERQNLLGESLRLFIKGARILEFDHLREVCGDYQQLNYAKGAIELPLKCAQVVDSDGIGFEFWSAGSPANDPRSEICERRLQCYDLVLDSLTVFEEKSASTKTAGAADPITVDLEAVRSHAYELAFASEDEMFHSTMYDWLIDRGVADELLEMRPAFLEAHLRREPATAAKFQLLWQFYVKDGQPLRAAEVLGTLAESMQFDFTLDTRIEYLTLAVGNAKSHPISVSGRHETAIAFLSDLEEKLDVAQVQLEIYHALKHVDDTTEDGEKVKLLSKRLFTMTELYQLYADPFDLPTMKLLCLHVSEHREENLVRPIWNRIFEDALEESGDPQVTADRIIAKIVPLGKRFYPSESAFPLRHIATLLVRFALSNKGVLPYGWASRILVQCGVPYTEIWDVFHEMYESQIPPFNDQANVQALSSDIAVLLSDWLEEAKRPQSSVGRGEFPVGQIDLAVDQYLAELEPGRAETKALYESIKRHLRRNW